MSAELPRMVLHVLNGAGGGAALSALGLMRSMNRQGVSAAAVCHDAGTQTERDALLEATSGRTVFAPLYWWNKKTRADAWKRPLLEAWQLLKTGGALASTRVVMAQARACNADLIHTNTLTTPEGGLAAMALALPHVWHVRELVGVGGTFRLPIEGPRLGAHLQRMCSVVVANSSATALRLSDWLPAGLMETVHNGIDISRFASLARPAARRRLVVAMIASMTSRWKQHDLFIECATRLASQDVELRIYGHDPSASGADPYVARLKEQIDRASLRDRFSFPGHHPPEAFLPDVDVIVHPTKGESFGRAVVEAMAAGVPVVGVRAGGVAELIDDGVTGFLAPPDDAVALASAVNGLVADVALRARIGNAARIAAKDRFSLEASARAIAAIYARALGHPKHLLRGG